MKKSLSDLSLGNDLSSDILVLQCKKSVGTGQSSHHIVLYGKLAVKLKVVAVDSNHHVEMATGHLIAVLVAKTCVKLIRIYLNT